MSARIETDVLVIGSGPAGGTAALALSTYGVNALVITKYHATANSPRAHITNQGAMEVFRDLGIESEVMRDGTPQSLMGNNVFCESLAGEELGRLKAWGTHPARFAEYTLASPTTMCDIPQTLLEPILVKHAMARGAKVRFSTEYLSLEQDEDGVTVQVLDRLTNQQFEVRARFVVGADGARSKVAEDIGLPMQGRMDVAGSMNIVFSADLTKYVAHRPSVLYWVLQPGSNVGGVGMGVVRMVRPWTEWLAIWGYDISAPPPILDDAAATKIVHDLIGDDTIDVRIRSTSLWSNNQMSAVRFHDGRVFCAGDAVHRHPPTNGLGSNTSVQDAHNLAWKIAMVLRGVADPALLDSYSDERAPVGRQIVDRANRSIDDYARIFDALGLLGTSDPVKMQANMAARKDATPEAAQQRRALRQAIAHKQFEFNCHGVELNQRYASSAVVPDATAAAAPTRDFELHYQPTSRPGARLPHVWVEQDGTEISTRDLVGHGRFTLLTGIGGEPWVNATRSVAAQVGTDIVAWVIGAGRDIEDHYGDWARVSEIEDDGCLLVRPDGFVAWRRRTLEGDPQVALANVVASLLGLAVGNVKAVDQVAS